MIVYIVYDKFEHGVDTVASIHKTYEGAVKYIENQDKEYQELMRVIEREVAE